MNQEEAAEYISARGIKVSGADMSILARYGAGPVFKKDRGRKVFQKEDLDKWVLAERQRRDDELDQRLSSKAS